MSVRPLDFVLTPKNQTALVTETNDNGNSISLQIIGENIEREHSAWYKPSDLKVIDNLAMLLSLNMAHPFGSGKKDVEHFYKE